MYKEDLALNNLQWLICHETKRSYRECEKLTMSTIIKEKFLNNLSIRPTVAFADNVTQPTVKKEEEKNPVLFKVILKGSGFEFRIDLLLNWLPTKAIERSLSSHLIPLLEKEEKDPLLFPGTSIGPFPNDKFRVFLLN